MKLLALAFGVIRANRAATAHRPESPRCWCRRPDICPWEELKRADGEAPPPA